MPIHAEDELFAEMRRDERAQVFAANENFYVRLPTEIEQLQAENVALLAELARTSVELTELKMNVSKVKYLIVQIAEFSTVDETSLDEETNDFWVDSEIIDARAALAAMKDTKLT